MSSPFSRFSVHPVCAGSGAQATLATSGCQYWTLRKRALLGRIAAISSTLGAAPVFRLHERFGVDVTTAVECLALKPIMIPTTGDPK
jgi:hypothetical protein